VLRLAVNQGLCNPKTGSDTTTHILLELFVGKSIALWHTIVADNYVAPSRKQELAIQKMSARTSKSYDLVFSITCGFLLHSFALVN
jgi:hypothetical protein